MNTFHLLAYVGSVAQNAVNANIPTIVDNFFTQQNGGMIYPRPIKILGAYVRLDSGSDAYLQSPLFRLPSYPRLPKFDTAADPPNLPPVNMWGDRGPILSNLDPLNVTVSRAGAGASVCQALLWCAPSMPPQATGQIRTIKATTAITLTTTGWVAGAMTLTDTLPPGTYQVVGMTSIGANLLAARLVFPDSSARPGVLAQQTVSEYGWDAFTGGDMGVWGQFQQIALPNIEVLGYGAGSSQTHYIDYIKVA